MSRRLLAVSAFLVFLGVAVAVTRPADVRAEGGGALVAEPVISATAAGVRELFGATPLEAPGEVWGVGSTAAGRQSLVHYTEAGGWEAVPAPVGPEGTPVGEMKIPEAASAGRTTPAGGVVTVAALGGEGTQALLVRDPGGGFRAVTPPEGFLAEGEELFEPSEGLPSVKLAPSEEASGATGAFVVPIAKSQTAVLHFDGTEWKREPICLDAAPEPCQAPLNGFRVIAVDAAGPGNAWLLAKTPRGGFAEPGQGVALLRRENGEWRRVTLGGPLGASYGPEESTIGTSKVFVNAREVGQPLTVSAKGVWVDVAIGLETRESPKSDTTFYLDTGEGDPGAGQVTGAWCNLPPTAPEAVTAAFCTGQLGSDLPRGQGRSFAWPGNGGPGEEFGTRAITGVGKGAMLIFENGGFSRIPLAGNGGTGAGAALSAPDQGWLGPSYRLTREPIPSGLVSWPVPFRHPLTAIAPQPGVGVGELGSQALAVGMSGQVARYFPGIGWQPESLLTGSGARATPNLRAVAWPVPGFAYAVGDEGAMWIWRAGSNMWEPDPGAPPNLIRGNFTGIAFDPDEPERGYAVGQQGLLLGYGRRWTQEALPAGIGSEPNITSIAFAGGEAIATWSQGAPLEPQEASSGQKARYIGGVIVNDGSGWRVESQASEALAAAEGAEDNRARPWLVAGLPDGGAAIAGATGSVIERQGPGAPWVAVPGSPVGHPAALAAVREGGQLRAIASVEANVIAAAGYGPSSVEEAQGAIQPPEGQAPLLIEPYPLPVVGYIVRQTATGWRDEEHQSYPAPPGPTDQLGPESMDIPRVPDAVLALSVSPDGSRGWAVGGQTGQMAFSSPAGPYQREGLQTAAAMRFGEEAAPPENSAAVPIAVPAGEATFAIGGNAQCADVCADLAGTGIGPDVWLKAAVAKAAATPGVRAFLYTGASVPGGLDQSKVSRDEFAEEEGAYARRLGSMAGALPVYAAPSESDLYESSLATFGREFEGFGAPLGQGATTEAITPLSAGERAAGNYSYSFESSGQAGEGRVRVIVLDYATAPLSQEKQCWLAAQLTEAKLAAVPAIVVGNRAADAEAPLSQLLVTGSNETIGVACPQVSPGAASAYLFDAPEANSAAALGWGGATIPEYGTGSLGYLRIPRPEINEYVAASGFLLASVATAARNPETNVAPVTARLIPSIGSLAIDARDGTLLRRSQVALFEALARRPNAGFYCAGNFLPRACEEVKPDPYVQIPARCTGQPSCATEILPEYRFSSSRPDIADFVEVDPASSNPRAAFLNGEGKPVPDPTSGLLCAFNSGTTTVSVEAGGLSYSIPVTVQAGSVARPCGTVPRTDLPATTPALVPPPPPLPTQPPFKTPPSALPPPTAPAPTPTPVVQPTPIPAPPHLPVPHPVLAKPPVPLSFPFVATNPGIAPVPVIVPPAPPAAAEPAPPTGTSPVTQPAVSPEPQEEEEAALDLVHHAVAVGRAPRAAVAAYRFEPRSGRLPLLVYALPSLVVIAVLSSYGIAGRSRRRRRPEPAFLHHDAKEPHR